MVQIDQNTNNSNLTQTSKKRKHEETSTENLSSDNNAKKVLVIETNEKPTPIEKPSYLERMTKTLEEKLGKGKELVEKFLPSNPSDFTFDPKTHQFSLHFPFKQMVHRTFKLEENSKELYTKYFIEAKVTGTITPNTLTIDNKSLSLQTNNYGSGLAGNVTSFFTSLTGDPKAVLQSIHFNSEKQTALFKTNLANKDYSFSELERVVSDPSFVYKKV